MPSAGAPRSGRLCLRRRVLPEQRQRSAAELRRLRRLQRVGDARRRRPPRRRHAGDLLPADADVQYAGSVHVDPGGGYVPAHFRGFADEYRAPATCVGASTSTCPLPPGQPGTSAGCLDCRPTMVRGGRRVRPWRRGAGPWRVDAVERRPALEPAADVGARACRRTGDAIVGALEACPTVDRPGGRLQPRPPRRRSPSSAALPSPAGSRVRHGAPASRGSARGLPLKCGRFTTAT